MKWITEVKEDHAKKMQQQSLDKLNNKSHKSKIMQYRKKPVVIDAIQWDATKDTWDKIKEMGCETKGGEMGTDSFFITTLEGDMKASKGDYIIKGVKGEFYPCKPDIFEATYEPVNPQPNDTK